MDSLEFPPFTLPKIWDLCLSGLYESTEYVEGIKKLFEKYGIRKSSRILDVACGTGFPAINLAEYGYDVTAADGNSDMLRRFEYNARVHFVRTRPHLVEWSNLAKAFGEHSFDLVMCRGNSLVYCDSWDKITETLLRESLLTALRNFHGLLKRRGVLYVDCTSTKEHPHEKSWFVHAGDQVKVTWAISYQNKRRTWKVRVQNERTHHGREISLDSYLLGPGELAQLLRQTGFSEIEQVCVDGENNYDVYLARK